MKQRRPRITVELKGSSSCLTHAGFVNIRSVAVSLNDTIIYLLNERGPSTDYAQNERFDKLVLEKVATLQQALPNATVEHAAWVRDRLSHTFRKPNTEE